MTVSEHYVDLHPGSDEHVSTGDPGGGNDPTLVLPGSYLRQKQAAPQEPGGVWSTWFHPLLFYANFPKSYIHYLFHSTLIIDYLPAAPDVHPVAGRS